jgi:hypothetical protein
MLFSRMIRLLELEKPFNVENYYKDFSDFKGKCIITNKKSYTQDIEELEEEKITVVQYFDIGKSILVVK